MQFFFFICALPLVFSAPEQVHLSFHGNYSTMGVTWITFKSDSSTVHYGNSPSDLPFSVKGSQTEWVTGSITRYTHRALLENLLPSTNYWYKIGSRTFQFMTLPMYPESYRVCIFGDLGRRHGNSTASIIRNGLAGMFDFVIHVGDIAYDLQDDDGKNGDKFMNQLEPLISRIPYMMVAGNHEYEGGTFSNFQQRFWMPQNGFDGNQFYSFDLGPVHWTALSTEYYGYYQELGSGPILDQYKWLENDLKAANSHRREMPWLFTYLHRPFYCSANHNNDCSDGNSTLIRIGNGDVPGLENAFVQYGVDIGFWGHVHYYERFYPVANEKYRNTENCYHNAQAPTYIITGSADLIRSFMLNDYGYTILTVANMTHIRIQQLSIDKDEAIVDDFWISKDLGSGVRTEMRI